jgi:hypothetical protein
MAATERTMNRRRRCLRGGGESRRTGCPVGAGVRLRGGRVMGVGAFRVGAIRVGAIRVGAIRVGGLWRVGC